MNIYWIILLVAIGIFSLILAIVAIRAVLNDTCLNLTQRIAYIFFSCFIPIIGPYTSLHFISQHYFKDKIPSVVPWPFYLLLIDRPTLPNKNKSEFDDYGGF